MVIFSISIVSVLWIATWPLRCSMGLQMIGVADGEAVDLLAKSWTATRILLLESGLAIVGAGVCKKAEHM